MKATRERGACRDGSRRRRCKAFDAIESTCCFPPAGPRWRGERWGSGPKCSRRDRGLTFFRCAAQHLCDACACAGARARAARSSGVVWPWRLCHQASLAGVFAASAATTRWRRTSSVQPRATVTAAGARFARCHRKGKVESFTVIYAGPASRSRRGDALTAETPSPCTVRAMITRTLGAIS